MNVKPKLSRDTNQLAKLIADVATQQVYLPEHNLATDTRNPAAVDLGRLGGMKG